MRRALSYPISPLPEVLHQDQYGVLPVAERGRPVLDDVD
jgi:hypothetical protein